MRSQTFSYVVQWQQPTTLQLGSATLTYHPGRTQQRAFTAISEAAAVALAKWCAAPGCTDFEVLPRFTLKSQ